MAWPARSTSKPGPGARLAVHGYAGEVLRRDAIFDHAYTVNGVDFVAYKCADGVVRCVERERVTPLRQSSGA